MLKLKHFRHPLRAFASAQTLVSAYCNMRLLAPRGERRFAQDPRFSLRNVDAGFALRPSVNSGDDTPLLQRICAAYQKAVAEESHVTAAYQPTTWWQSVRRASLAPVRHALLSGDIPTLRALYQNFFRNTSSGGLIGVPYQMAAAYSGGSVPDRYRRFFLSDALHRIDYWQEQTQQRFPLSALVGPDIGNPFGVVLDDVLIRTATEYHHYYSQRIQAFLPSAPATVAEIGGGFGSMAYYLVRDRPATTYLDFDVPESIALTSYYLLTAFPQLNFLLFGEADLATALSGDHQVVLFPAFTIPQLPAKSINLAFSSHTLANLAPPAIAEYLAQLVRFTRHSFLYIDRGPQNVAFQNQVRRAFPSLQLVEKHKLDWHRHKFRNAAEEECLYTLPLQ